MHIFDGEPSMFGLYTSWAGRADNYAATSNRGERKSRIPYRPPTVNDFQVRPEHGTYRVNQQESVILQVSCFIVELKRDTPLFFIILRH